MMWKKIQMYGKMYVLFCNPVLSPCFSSGIKCSSMMQCAIALGRRHVTTGFFCQGLAFLLDLSDWLISRKIKALII